jgi:8-oxo-dGTP pyrophosphatase MutT (NUDIX family)
MVATNKAKERPRSVPDRDADMDDLMLRLRTRLKPTASARSDYDLSPHLRPASPVALKPAAVLVPIVLRRQGLMLLLTRRADHLPAHGGQVGFPGGRIEQGDASPVEAALREAEEEIGLERRFIEVVGRLDSYETGTGFRICPIVALVQEGFALTIDKREVAEAFEVPLAFLMDPRNHERHRMLWRGKEREFYAMPYERNYIWGATAGMIVNLYTKLYGGDAH